MAKPNWQQIRKEWETSKITFKDLAEKHNVKLGTLKSRRSREKWSRDATSKKDATLSKKMQPKKESKEPVVESDNLTEKQRLFCIYYIKYFNATKAYQKAYECAYSTARVEGHRHLANPNINAEIDRMKEEQTTDLKLGVRDILQKYIDIAFADITDFVTFGTSEIVQKDEYSGEPLTNEDGEPLTDYVTRIHLVDSDEVDGTILTEVKEGRDGISVKLADKMRALEMLSKYFDLLSNSDKERFQLEKLKVETAKANAEVKKIEKENKTDAPPEITIVDAWTDKNE